MDKDRCEFCGNIPYSFVKVFDAKEKKFTTAQMSMDPRYEERFAATQHKPATDGVGCDVIFEGRRVGFSKKEVSVRLDGDKK